jgi:hypothetical protein
MDITKANLGHLSITYINKSPDLADKTGDRKSPLQKHKKTTKSDIHHRRGDLLSPASKKNSRKAPFLRRAPDPADITGVVNGVDLQLSEVIGMLYIHNSYL